MNVDDIVFSLSKIVEFKEIDSIHDLYGCIKFCMEFVENFKALNGEKKKEIVINSITYIITNNIETGVRQEMFLDFLDPTVEMVIQISKNKCFFNGIKHRFKCWM